jgi:hypothetical protein
LELKHTTRKVSDLTWRGGNRICMYRVLAGKTYYIRIQGCDFHFALRVSVLYWMISVDSIE